MRQKLLTTHPSLLRALLVNLALPIMLSTSSMVFAVDKYEAENATLLGGANTNNNWTGYSGTGFVDAMNNAGNGVQFTVNAATAGEYKVYMTYANATGTEKRLSIYVNGKYEKRAYFPTTPNWGTWISMVRTVTLKAGTNTITYIYEPEDSGNVNLDFIEVEKESYDLSFNTSLLDAIPVSSTSSSGSFTTTFDNNITQFDNSKWYPKWDEKDVFHMQMSHSQTNNNYTMRIGEGGQIYSFDTPIGEIMPPQNIEHAWIDDMLLATSNQYDGQDFESSRFAHSYIHQAGCYQHYDYDQSYLNTKSFWSPLVSERLDPSENQYATLNWPQMSTGLSVNRSDMLIYLNSRDLGDGIIELTYMFYNYNDTYQYLDNTDLSAWGGVRDSKLPRNIVSNTDGTWFESTAQFGQPGHFYDSNATGGWIGATQDINDPDGYTIAYVFGQNPTAHGGAGLSRYVTIGDAGRDDYAVMLVNYREHLVSGEAYYFRMYLVVGSLQDVVTKANAIQEQLEYGFINFEQDTAPTSPLYLQQIDGQTVLTENGAGTPALEIFTQPVQDSKPLFLIRNTSNGKYLVSSDPYILNDKVQLSVQDDSKQRLAVRPYDGNSEVIKLFGFVMPNSKIDQGLSYERLDAILTDSTYYPKSGLYDADIMVLSSGVPTLDYDEAENNILAGNAVVVSKSNASGGLAVDQIGYNGPSHYLQFNQVNVPTTGSYTIRISYATGDTRTADLTVNGGTSTNVSFPATGSFDTWLTRDFTANLDAGDNTLRIANNTTGQWAPLIDKIQVISQTGYNEEAENNTLAGNAVVVSKSNASGGLAVDQIGYNGPSHYLQFNQVNVPTTGSYTIRISYATGDTRTADLTVNGGTSTNVSFPATGSFDTWLTRDFITNLDAGDNTLRIANNTTGQWAPLIDKIQVISGQAQARVSNSVETSTQTDTEEDGIRIYPNPASAKLIIETPLKEPQKISIGTISGRVIMVIDKGQLESGKIEVDVSKLTKGVYFIKIESPSGSVSKKIILE